MKLTFFQPILLLVFSLFCIHANAQIDSSEDSIIYIVPEQVDADVNMIVPPAGFIVSDLFNGYIHLQASSAIMMVLIKNVNFLKIQEGMTEEFYAQNKLTLISDEPIISNFGVRGHKYKFSFRIDETDFVRYMVYAGDLNQSLWLNITYPKLLEDFIEADMLKSIQTITLNPSRDEK